MPLPSTPLAVLLSLAPFVIAFDVQQSLTVGDLLQIVTVIVCIASAYQAIKGRLTTLESTLDRLAAVVDEHDAELNKHNESIVRLSAQRATDRGGHRG